MPNPSKATHSIELVTSLRTKNEVAAFLNTAFEASANDPRRIAEALGTAARAYGISQLSRDTGIARENLYRSLSLRGNPSLSSLTKVVRALGLRLRVEL